MTHSMLDELERSVVSRSEQAGLLSLFDCLLLQCDDDMLHQIATHWALKSAETGEDAEFIDYEVVNSL